MTAVEPAQPFHLQGNYAPVPDELTATDLRVRGALPPALTGTYVRNGPNPLEPSGHWFMGDGMLHGVRLEGGRASWYRNRWVRTRRFVEGPEVQMIGPDGTVDHTVAVANTHVVGHAGKVMALVESSFPTLVDDELGTVGTYDFDGRLRTAMTAHPKVCPETGELLFFGYGFFPPYLTYHRADASGALVQSTEIPVRGPTMVHDFAITRSRAVFFDLPVVFDLERAMQGTMPYRWDDAYGARVGVMPRDGGAGDVTWFEVEPCYVFHTLNAWDEGDRVVVDVVRYDELWRQGADRFDPSTLHRWVLDLPSGKATEERLDDAQVEFPRCDDRLAGLPNRLGWAVETRSAGAAGPGTGRLVGYDVRTGERTAHDFGTGRLPGEAVFVAASDSAPEGEGWLMCYVYDASRDASDLVVLDASDLAGPEVAAVELPRRVPFGFHGSWLPAQPA